MGHALAQGQRNQGQPEFTSVPRHVFNKHCATHKPRLCGIGGSCNRVLQLKIYCVLETTSAIHRRRNIYCLINIYNWKEIPLCKSLHHTTTVLNLNSDELVTELYNQSQKDKFVFALLTSRLYMLRQY